MLFRSFVVSVCCAFDSTVFSALDLRPNGPLTLTKTLFLEFIGGRCDEKLINFDSK